MKSFWSGAIGFGLIYIPVRLYTATREKRLDFDLLRKKDLCRIRYARVCRATGEEVPYDQIVKGYEYKKGDYVVLQEDDFRKASPKKSKTIEIKDFVKEEEIDIKYFEKPYFLEPEDGAGKAYSLLREALRKSGKVAVANFVIRNVEHLGVLKSENNILILNQMRFSSEIRVPEGLNIPKSENVSERELEMAIKLVTELTEPFNPERYKDKYTEDLKKMIEEKARGKRVKVKEEAPVATEVTDLMDKLRESLSYARQTGVH